MKKIRIGSRGSALARTQTGMVMDALKGICPELEMELVIIRSTGDKFRDRPLSQCGTGAFTRELERALLDGEIDLAVHSMKDMPICQPEGLVLCPPPERADCRDVLILREGLTPEDLSRGSYRIGTGSPRRRALLKKLYPHTEAVPIRGNIETRMGRVRQDLDGVILAAAGLHRAGLQEQITAYLDPAEFVPAPAQGVLALECRQKDLPLRELAEKLSHRPTDLAARAERAFLRATGAGCHAPVGAWCREEAGLLFLTGLYGEAEGGLVWGEMTGREPEELGIALGAKLMEAYKSHE